MTPVSIRQCTHDDLEFILSMEHGEKNVIQWSMRQYLQKLDDPSMILLVGIGPTDERIAYAILKTDSPEPGSTEFIRLVVDPQVRSSGYGTTLFHLIWEQTFADANVHRIWHDVYEDNHGAVKLYRRLGYRQFSRSVDPSTGRPLLHFELSRADYQSSF